MTKNIVCVYVCSNFLMVIYQIYIFFKLELLQIRYFTLSSSCFCAENWMNICHVAAVQYVVFSIPIFLHLSMVSHKSSNRFIGHSYNTHFQLYIFSLCLSHSHVHSLLTLLCVLFKIIETGTFSGCLFSVLFM